MAHLRPRFASSWVLSFLLLAGAASCSPGYVSADSVSDGTDVSTDSSSGGSDGSDSDDGSGGTDGSGGSNDGSGGTDGSGGSDGSGGVTTDGSAGGSDTGGTATDGPVGGGNSGGATSNSGGSSSSGGANQGTGGAFDPSCEQGDSCMPAANFYDECFDPACSSPVGARSSEVEMDPCLVPWEERQTQIPEDCPAFERDMNCPGICEVQPPCFEAHCDGGTGKCEVEICVVPPPV